jgi:hypothetical protein
MPVPRIQVGDHPGVQHVGHRYLAGVLDPDVGQALHRHRVPLRVRPGRDGDLRQLLGSGPVLVRVTGGDQRVVGDDIQPERYLDIVGRAWLPASRPGHRRNHDAPAARCLAVGQQRHPRLSRGDRAARIGCEQFEGAAADVGGAQHVRVEA